MDTRRISLSEISHTICPVNVDRVIRAGKQERHITLELIEGHWPYDDQLIGMYKEVDTYGFVTNINARIKIVTIVEKL